MTLYQVRCPCCVAIVSLSPVVTSVFTVLWKDIGVMTVARLQNDTHPFLFLHLCGVTMTTSPPKNTTEAIRCFCFIVPFSFVVISLPLAVGMVRNRDAAGWEERGCEGGERV